MSGVPQLDSSWFLSQAFWFLLFFGLNVFMHYLLIIPFLRRSAIELRHKKRDLINKINALKELVDSNKNRITELELEHKNCLSNIYLKAEEEANQEFISQMHKIRSDISKERQGLQYAFLQNKTSFMKDFSGSISDLATLISDKMSQIKGGGDGRSV